MEKEKPIAINEDKYIFKLKDKEQDISYTLTFSIESEALMIEVVEDHSVPLICYSAKFTLSDLVKQSRYFKLFETLDQFLPEIESLINDEKVSLQKKNTDMILKFSLPLKIIEEVFLPIPQGEVDQQKVINDLCSTVNELRKKIKSLTVNISEEQLKRNLESKEILLDEEEKKMVCDWILKQMKSEGKQVQMTLLYRLTKDNDSASTFHSKCNNQGPTLSLIRNTKGYRCGGFTSKSWCSYYNSYSTYTQDSNAFLFSLDYKEQYFTYDGQNAIYDYSGLGPSFGSNDLYISKNCSQNMSSYSNFPYDYSGNKMRALTGGYYNFKVQEIEVYKINII